MTDSASILTYGLIIGFVFGIVVTVVFSRLAGKVRGIGRLFGRDVQARRLAELEKENTALTRRLEDKDEYIRKAMESLVEQEEPPSPKP